MGAYISTLGNNDPDAGSITAKKLADGAVTTEKIADNAVTTGKIGNAAVTSSKIADNAVTSSKIANGAITAAKIANGAIPMSKISDIGGTGSNGGKWGYIPIVKEDGGTELGQYIDLHLTANDGLDRYVRLRIYENDPPTVQVEGGSYGVMANIVGGHIHGKQIHAEEGYFGTLGYPLKITFNGTEYEYTMSSASASNFANGMKLYAPTSAGTSGYVLKSNGSGVPVWVESAPLATAFKVGSTTVTFTAFYNAFTEALKSLEANLSDLQNRIETLENKFAELESTTANEKTSEVQGAE